MDKQSNTITLPESRTTIAEAWAIGFARLSAAEAAEKAFDANVWRPAFHISEKGGPDIPVPISEEMERLQDVTFAAEKALQALPAPDLHALLWKFERHRELAQGLFLSIDETLEIVAADLTRFAEGVEP